jgi:predicted ATPase
MRDAATDRQVEEQFRGEDGWSTSLLRFSQASSALEAGRRLVTGERKKEGQMSFVFEGKLGESDIRLSFRFDDATALPGRCNVLIGYNGAGKTRLLAEIAQAASRYGLSQEELQRSRINGEDTNFARVIAVSYSAFDTFETPSRTALNRSEKGTTEVFGYVYCGLREFANDGDARPTGQRLKSIAAIETEFSLALREAGRREQSSFFFDALDALAGEPSFGRIGVDLRDLAGGIGSKHALEDFQRLSTGHKIVLNIVTQLAAHLRHRSLVLIDEPETHLHPPLTAALLKAIQLLLDAYDSFAVIATHSPVVLQEVPAQFVQVLERVGTRTWVRGPSIETFAEGVGVITRQVFSLDSSATDYQGVLAHLAERMTLEQIDDLFSNGLSSQGRALVLNYLNRG